MLDRFLVCWATRRSTRVAISLVLGAFVLSLAASAAAVVAPRKPSELRVARGDTVSSPMCPGGTGRRVDTRQNPDGTTSPFSIPAKSVFVVTSFDWIAATEPGGLAGVDLFVVDAAGTSFAFISHARAVATATVGNGGGTVATPEGAVVKSGSHLCFLGTGASLTAVVVRGFLTKDK